MKIYYLLAGVIFFLALSSSVQAATFTAAASGNWNVGTTWGGACASGCSAGTDYPGSADVATIASSKTVTLTQAEAATTLNLNSTGILSLDSNTLTVSGTATLASGSTLNSNGGTLKGGSVLMSGCAVGGAGAVTIEKTGSTTSSGSGGNTFANTTTIKNSGTGTFSTANSSADTFNGDVTFTTTGGSIQPSRAGNNLYNGNIVVESSGTSGISFGATSGSSTLATGKTISVGGAGFSSGTLTLARFTQSGATDQTITLTGTAGLTINTASNFAGGVSIGNNGSGLVSFNTVTFNGNVSITSPSLSMNTVTFNGTTYLEHTGGSAASMTGNNTFAGATTIKNNGDGQLTLANTTRDTYNGDVTFNSASTGLLSVARSGSNLFNGNITLISTSTGGITFGANTGSSTLATSKTITIGSDGFTGGTLTLTRFTQNGATAQNLALTGGNLTINTGSSFAGDTTITNTGTALTTITATTFDGALNLTSPRLTLATSAFNGATTIEKNGASADTSTGSNTFSGATILKTSGSGGTMTLGNTTGDTFASNLQLVQTDGTLTISSVGTTTFSKSSGTQTLDAGGLTIPKLSHTGAGTLQLVTNPITISSSLNNSAGTFDANGITINLNGNYFNTATFTASAGTVNLSRRSKQSLYGTMTGGSAFYNLSIDNISGTAPSDDERTGFSAGVEFKAAATISGTFTIASSTATTSTLVEFASGSTYTVGSINWNGYSASTPIYFRNSDALSTWLLNVSGTQTAVSYVNVSHSDASGGSAIAASDGTNHDGSNNTNWTFTSNSGGSGGSGGSSGSTSSGSGSNGPIWTTPIHLIYPALVPRAQIIYSDGRVVYTDSNTATSTSATSTAPSTSANSKQFLINLKKSQTHPDIKSLQIFLNNHGFVVATSGPGSLGNETNYFGSKTKAALIKFQESYADEILKPVALLKGTGNFYSLTRAKINQLLTP